MAHGQLPGGRPDLPPRQPAAPRTAPASSTPSRGLLGHWGTTPGPQPPVRAPQPGHPQSTTSTSSSCAVLATADRRWSPAPISRAPTPSSTRTSGRDEDGLHKLFRQFSFPGGIPSHAAATTPGSINEGGELGYSLVHAYGAVFDNPDLIAACVIGDGEAETGALATSWHSNKFLDPVRDGAVLPILHLNGWKIANPTVLARIPDERSARAARGVRLRGPRRRGRRARTGASSSSPTRSTRSSTRIREIQHDARAQPTSPELPRWPMIVLRTPKGWTGPKVVDGEPVEGTWRAHQVPLAGLATNPEHLALLESWMKSYRPEELFDERGAVRAEITALCPDGDRRMGANPHANGGLLLRDLDLPDFRDLRGRRAGPRRPAGGGDPRPRHVAARRDGRQPRPVPHHGTRRDRVEPPAGRLRDHGSRVDGEAAAGRRPPRARRPGDGGAVGAPVRRAGSRATCSPVATASSTRTKRSSTSSTRCSTSTRSG